jgi:hypothetical protein
MSFETRFKSKLPKNMAFPTSAKILQEMLDVAGQELNVSVSYFYHKPKTPGRQQKTSMGSANRTVRDSSTDIIEAKYVRSAMSVWTPNDWLKDDSSMNTYSKDQWTLNISAVLVSDLPAVRKCLEDEGYGRLRDWFAGAKQTAGSIGYHSLTLGFDGQRLTYQNHDRM